MPAPPLDVLRHARALVDDAYLNVAMRFALRVIGPAAGEVGHTASSRGRRSCANHQAMVARNRFGPPQGAPLRDPPYMSLGPHPNCSRPLAGAAAARAGLIRGLLFPHPDRLHFQPLAGAVAIFAGLIVRHVVLPSQPKLAVPGASMTAQLAQRTVWKTTPLGTVASYCASGDSVSLPANE
jgi:hypothetical protein